MSLQPMPFDMVLVAKRIEFLPKLGVLDGFLVGGPPAVLFPAVNPPRDAVFELYRSVVRSDEG